MPNRDQTGPAGLGPMTVRGAGLCADVEIPGCMGFQRARRVRGRGLGRGGNGLQFRQRRRDTITALQEQIHHLEDELQKKQSAS